jgi:hypothetical protein
MLHKVGSWMHPEQAPPSPRPMSISQPTLVSSSAMNRSSPFPDARYSIPTEPFSSAPPLVHSYASVPVPPCHRSSHHLAPGSKSMAALTQTQQDEPWIPSMLPTPAVSVHKMDAPSKRIGAADLEHLIHSLDQQTDSCSMRSDSIHLSQWSPKGSHPALSGSMDKLTDCTPRQQSWASGQLRNKVQLSNRSLSTPHRTMVRSASTSDLPPLAPPPPTGPWQEEFKRDSNESQGSDYMQQIYHNVFP